MFNSSSIVALAGNVVAVCCRFALQTFSLYHYRNWQTALYSLLGLARHERRFANKTNHGKMKQHKIKPNYSFFEPDDSFKTWCGISDMDSPSEECMENFVYNWDECTCKKCKQAYGRDIKNFEKQRKTLNEALNE